MDERQKIYEIREWYRRVGPKNFKMDFVENLEEALEEWGELTWAQNQALDNIIERWVHGRAYFRRKKFHGDGED
jgi:hypothetical protein